MADFKPSHRNYVLGVLTLGYALNAFDRRILSILLEPIKLEFGVSDMYLGLLGGVAFALFYATFSIPIALWADRSNRRNVLALAVLVWSTMTVLCGFAATFLILVLARIGTAIGEAGGSPPSHSLLANYFSAERRGTALSIYALGAPAGAMLAGLLGGIGNELFGWRITFALAGLPGLLLAPLILTTILEPRTAVSTAARPGVAVPTASSFREVASFLWQRASFRHLCAGCALHSVAVYSGATFNAAFLIRSHEWDTAQAGALLAAVGGCGVAGTFLGGLLADRLSARFGDSRWYMWIPGVAILILVPIQLIGYLSSQAAIVMGAFAMGGFLSTVFFGPSFATTQALAAPQTRATAASIVIFVKAMVGLGLGPLLIGRVSDLLLPVAGRHSLRYALLLLGLFGLWSAVHFMLGARRLRADLDATARFAATPITAGDARGRHSVLAQS
jgi:predicted MFS family arabinose efflux permease